MEWPGRLRCLAMSIDFLLIMLERCWLILVFSWLDV